MGDRWRFFRVSGPRPPQIPNEYFTMEIHHGGYFDKMPDGTKKYKIAKFNKLGGVLYCDALDPEKLAWVELNNIAWELGYREKPISYCYKLPGTLSCEGWIPLKNDADVFEMTKQISKKKRQISLYITGGGRRKKKDAELDDIVPRPSNWHNPLNNVLAAEKINIDVSANLVASQINRSYMEKTTGIGVRSSVNGRRDDWIINDDGVNEGVLGDGLNEVVKNDSEVGRGLCEVVNEGSVVENKEGHEGNLNISNVAVRKPTIKKRAAGQEKGKDAIIEAPLEAGGFKKKGRQVKGSKYNTRNKGKKKYDKVGSDDGSGGSDFFIDSDYEQDQRDDDIDFEENVANPERVEEYDEMGYDGLCSDNEDNTDELTSWDGSETEEDDEGNLLPKCSEKKTKVKAWNRAVDLRNPKFCVGQAFPNVEELREAVREYSLINQRGLWFQKNNRQKVEVKCQWGCPFWLYASKIDKNVPTLYIKTLRPAHKCHPIQTSHHLNSRRVAKDIAADLMVDDEWSRKGIQNVIQKKYKLDLTVQTVFRGRRMAKRLNEGHYTEQYNKLASYRKELLRSNPGSTIMIKTEMDGEIRRFQRMYVCFAACKEGWKKGCRPVIGLDGCHIKGQHSGQILSAVGIDANNGMYPIAYAIAESENYETWKWFLEYLIEDLKLENGLHYTFITDKQKGLQNAIAELIPGAEHRHCVRHLYNNFKSKHPGEGLKQTMWNAARSSTPVWYNKNMVEMQAQSEEAYKWFEDKSPSHWSRSHFRTSSKCDILLNNLCESFNAAILPARDKPPLAMMESIRMNMMTRMANRRVACTRWKDPVGPRVAKMIDKIGQWTSNYRAHLSGEFWYQVTGESATSLHSVDLGQRICTCRRWQLSGIPCVHAICAIFKKKENPALYVDEFLHPQKYLDSYSPIIFPIAGDDDWEQVEYPIAPPLYRRQAGRPKMKRNKEPGEKMAPPAPESDGTSRMPKSQYGTKMTCTICNQKGHNKKGCPTNKSKSGEGSSRDGQAKKRQNTQQAKRATAPKRSKNAIPQVITSKMSYKKRKAAEEASSSHAVPPSSKARKQPSSKARRQPSSDAQKQPRSQGTKEPSTQATQQQTSQVIEQVQTSQIMQQSQTSSEWASF